MRKKPSPTPLLLLNNKHNTIMIHHLHLPNFITTNPLTTQSLILTFSKRSNNPSNPTIISITKHTSPPLLLFPLLPPHQYQQLLLLLLQLRIPSLPFPSLIGSNKNSI